MLRRNVQCLRSENFTLAIFTSTFHHLNGLADTVRPFLGRDSTFSWRYSKSYTYDQLYMAGTCVQDYKRDTFTWHGTRFEFFLLGPSLFRVEGWLGHRGGERRKLRLPKRILVHECFQTLGDLAKRITREKSVFRNVTFLLNLELNCHFKFNSYYIHVT